MNSSLIKKEEVVVNYYDKINNLIQKTKQNIERNINFEMIELYYKIGTTINELIDVYSLDASQNEIIKLFSQKLISEFGQWFSVL